MGIIVQVLGSLLILIGFVFSQLGKLKTTSLNYLLLNAIGALILGIDAFIGKQEYSLHNIIYVNCILL